LFIGDGSSFLRLAALLEQGSTGELADLLVCHGICLNVTFPADETVVVRDGTTIVWRIAAEHLEKYAAQIRAIVEMGGHHYLDAPKVTDIDVMVSQGEYSVNVFADV